jgi:hypothetical protein
MQLLRLAAVTGLALVAVGGVLAGCGGNNAPATSTTQSVSAPITKAQARAYARAINLRAADLPRMNAGKPEHEGKAPTRLELALAHCDGELNPQLRVLNRVSPTFTSSAEGEYEYESENENENENEHEQIHSTVEVLPNQTIAAQHNAATGRHELST